MFPARPWSLENEETDSWNPLPFIYRQKVRKPIMFRLLNGWISKKQLFLTVQHPHNINKLIHCVFPIQYPHCYLLTLYSVLPNTHRHRDMHTHMHMHTSAQSHVNTHLASWGTWAMKIKRWTLTCLTYLTSFSENWIIKLVGWIFFLPRILNTDLTLYWCLCLAKPLSTQSCKSVTRETRHKDVRILDRVRKRQHTSYIQCRNLHCPWSELESKKVVTRL